MQRQCSLPAGRGSAAATAAPRAATPATPAAARAASRASSARPFAAPVTCTSQPAAIPTRLLPCRAFGVPSLRGSRRPLVACAAEQGQGQGQQQLAAAEPGKTVLGFVGIGIMGLAMTRNLLKAGYSVVVWNRNPDKCKALEQEGAKVASSPKAVAQAATYTFAMLSDPEAALAVAGGSDGIAAGLSAGKGYVDVSTVDAATSRHIAAAVRAAGAAFLEAPVSGSKGPAEQGKLIFLTAGDRALYDAVSPPLDAMGKAKFFLGEEGAGANMKLVVNMVMGSMMASFSEGLALADKVGLQSKDVIDVIGLGAIAAPMFALKGPAMAQRAYAPAFPLKHQQKDMRLALALGDEVAQPLPTAAAANALYIAARKQGLGDQDFSAVMEAVAGQHQQQQQ